MTTLSVGGDMVAALNSFQSHLSASIEVFMNDFGAW